MKILRFIPLAATLAAIFACPGLGRAQYRGAVDDSLAGAPSQTLALADGDAAATTPQAPAGMLTDEAIKRLVDQRLAEIKKEEEQKKKDAAAQGYEVGSDLSLKASLKPGQFPWLETPNKDFTMHLSLWTQWDNVWWNQTPGLRAARDGNAGPNQGVASGDTTGGIGNLQDGVYFRRIRPNVEGTFWETGEYRFIPAFENNQFNSAGIDEMWVGAKGLPVIGTLRVGHVKNAMGLEGDMTASSRCMTFMERSCYSEAIELNQNFVAGLWLSNTYLDERLMWNFVTFSSRCRLSSTDAFFGDGQWGLQGRITGLPLYEDEGRHLLHLGISSGFRNGTTNLANSPINAVQLRARPEMRDDAPAGSIVNSDTNRMIDTGVMASDSQYLMGLEALYVRGPLSLQAEYGWTWIQDVTGIFNPYAPPTATPPGVFTPFATAQNYMFNGGYVQLAYTLTGENRAYDKRMGSLSRAYFGGQGPYNNAWLVRDENGCLNWNTGAWEIATRYSYANLNDGSGANRIQGGIMNGFGLALNWYLNSNLTVNFDWNLDTRYDVPVGTPGNPSTVPGDTNGFGTRVQFQF